MCEQPGGPEVLQLSDVSEPQLGPGDVLIDVVAAGVNRADLLQRQGRYPPPPGASPVLGLECSGRISALGPEVEGWVVGDEVCALLTGGGYAQQVVVPSGQLLTIPRGVSLVDAAALPEAGCTVWSNLVMAAQLSRGESLLVHGGGSGIGTMAIQIARMRGAIPIVTVGSDRKAEFCRALGAEVVINHHVEDFVDVVRETTDGKGVDVVLDIIGAKYLTANLRALASDGRLVIIGLQGGVKAELDLGRLLSRRLSVMGTTLRSRSATAKAEIVSEVAAQVWPAVAEGAVRPVVDRVVPWQQAAEAHRLLERGESIGKVVLQVADALE